MKINKNNLLGFVIFMTAFSGIRSLLPLGELSYEGFTFPVLLFVFFGLATGSFKVEKKVLIIASILLVVLMYDYGANFSLIGGHNFKGRSGNGKFFSQLILLFIFLLYSSFLYHRFRDDGYKFIAIIKKNTLYSFYLVAGYSFIEFAAFYSSSADAIINQIDSIIRPANFNEYSSRLRGLQYEAPAFGAYLGFVSIIFLERIFLDKKKWFILNYILVFLFAINSGSRTALAACFLIAIFYMFTLSRAKIISIRVLMVAMTSIFLVGLTSSVVQSKISSITNFSENENYHAVSNLIRFGSQVAAINMAMDRPWKGVGFGQYGFEARHYYPDWLVGVYLSDMYSSDNASNWPPSYSFYARFLAEFGVPLFLFFILIFSRTLLRCYRKIGNSNETYPYIFISNLLFYSAIVFLQFDSLRNIHFWHAIVLVMIFNNEKSSSTYRVPTSVS